MEQKTIRYPIGVQSFRKLRENGFVYIDKTGFIPLLLENNYYFLSRPRRFGKSLLLSTLEAYFQGRKDLFEGLEISKWEKDWIEYPVVHVDFNTCKGTDIADVVFGLRKQLTYIARNYALPQEFIEEVSDEKYPLHQFLTDLIIQLREKFSKNVVVLIDEYDRGILEVMHDEELLEEATSALRPFFNVLKSSDQHIRFAMVTGVSRFRNTTLFSGANNLKDISLDPRYASLLGISHDELEKYFEPAVREFADAKGWTCQATLEELKNRYDGYRFTEKDAHLYNPFSLLNALDEKRLGNYWVQTGSTRSLEIHLREAHFSFDQLTDRWVSEEELGRTYSREDPLSLLFQTGYLTIGDFDGFDYRLVIPNREVQSTLVKMVVPEFVENAKPREVDDAVREIRLSLRDGDVDRMMEALRPLLAKVPYHEIDVNARERHLHLCFYVIFLMMGADARCEVASAAGRVDMVVQTPWKVFVFEFKMDESPETALRQIDEKGYAIPWESRGRDVYKIGVEFSSTLRTIARWKTQR